MFFSPAPTFLRFQGGIRFTRTRFIIFFGTAEAKEIVFADLEWNSVKVHNRIAGFIVEHGFGYNAQYLPSDMFSVFDALTDGEADVLMECWVSNHQGVYDKSIESGAVSDIGTNFTDSWQGWMIPTYVIKGDKERNIEPMAPDLDSVDDLSRYWELFRDPEDPDKGRFHSCNAGWECQKINEAKLAAYGLNKTYNIHLPKSVSEQILSLESTYKRGRPWFGYYWAPSWIVGKLDMTPLIEPPFDEKIWTTNRACAYPPQPVRIVVRSELEKNAPDVIEFLKKYRTTTALNNNVLAHMHDTGGDLDATAIWFLMNYKDLWKKWVPEDVAKKVEDAL